MEMEMAAFRSRTSRRIWIACAHLLPAIALSLPTRLFGAPPLANEARAIADRLRAEGVVFRFEGFTKYQGRLPGRVEVRSANGTRSLPTVFEIEFTDFPPLGGPPEGKDRFKVTFMTDGANTLSQIRDDRLDGCNTGRDSIHDEVPIGPRDGAGYSFDVLEERELCVLLTERVETWIADALASGEKLRP